MLHSAPPFRFINKRVIIRMTVVCLDRNRGDLSDKDIHNVPERDRSLLSGNGS